jgi:membrane-bound lytic murein transglycosylase MltF
LFELSSGVARSLLVVLSTLACPLSTPGPAAAQTPPPKKPAAAKPAPTAPAAQHGAAALNMFRSVWKGDLDGMIKRRYIRVATTYSKTNYFIDMGTQRGTVYESFKLFEDQLNAKLKTKHLRVNVVFIPMSRDELLRAVVEGRADVAAAALTVTPERQALVDFSQATRTDVDEIVVTGPGAPKIAAIDDLAGREVFVQKSSSYYQSLTSLNAKLKSQGKKQVTIKLAPEELEAEDLLEMVNAGLMKISVVDNYLAEFWKQLLPALVLHPEVALRTGGQLAVAMRKNSPQMMAAANEWIKKNGPKTMFGNLMTQRYLKSTKLVKSATSEAEMKRFQAITAFFRKYADKYQLDYLLMAAQGYQESGLDQNAKSRAGAIGVMQVMPRTAKELQVGNIRRVENNIHAGVKYIRFMIDKYYANEPMDQLNKGLFAFASYNAGPTRIKELRLEAQKRGLNQNVWFNNVEQIASERIGRETVTYVSNIYKYYVAYRIAIDELAERKQQRPQH